MQQDIVQLGAAVLRAKAKPIEVFNTVVLAQLIEKLLCTVTESNGVGLAAPQINQSVCVLVIASKPNQRYPNAPLMLPVVMINPSFQTLSTNMAIDWEGCLSIPGIRALVPRFTQIKVIYQDVNGDSQQLELTDFPARVFQHEYDHLAGLVYLDRVQTNQDIIADTEFFKLIEPT